MPLALIWVMRIVWPLLALFGCATARFAGDVYRDREVAFRIGSPGPEWRRLSLGGGDVVLRRADGGAMLVNAVCKGIKDVPLDVLANQALFGVNETAELSRETVTLDGRAALRLRLAGTLDGVPVDLDLVVLKKDGCVYDLQLVAGPAVFAERDREFDQVVSGFATLARGG